MLRGTLAGRPGGGRGCGSAGLSRLHRGAARSLSGSTLLAAAVGFRREMPLPNIRWLRCVPRPGSSVN